ncbi:uncharacterized protein PHALS_14906 [Plasmopara halstedii]|uniref:Uncharacterized protein n=1 Tax=Plasmopara halstedii TaxID=4781 RepID=A0A0P1A7M8_PLAHL|nr:uncharacterized protein PHALS_14906 [Plasmopara halstedii]CEG36482.1 hypothetical protein PHALS_14906 [Plasmopara halstedii]|eukprot:XP_024572851.1 hypothetical protein PHALS_14906 [Plasmopara halstedii]
MSCNLGLASAKAMLTWLHNVDLDTTEQFTSFHVVARLPYLPRTIKVCSLVEGRDNLWIMLMCLKLS